MNNAIDILYSDNDIIICIKPVGILSTDSPGGLPDLLRIQTGINEIKTVHRLDQMVGGVMILARNKSTARLLSDQINGNLFRKTYLAIVNGFPAKTQGVFSDYLLRNREERKTYVVDKYVPGSQYAELRYRTLAQYLKWSLVKIHLITGRTHQIRCQFSSRGMPILGDRKYSLSEYPDYTMALWSYEVSFEHPHTGKIITVKKNPPNKEPWNHFPCLRDE